MGFHFQAFSGLRTSGLKSRTKQQNYWQNLDFLWSNTHKILDAWKNPWSVSQSILKKWFGRGMKKFYTKKIIGGHGLDPCTASYDKPHLILLGNRHKVNFHINQKTLSKILSPYCEAKAVLQTVLSFTWILIFLKPLWNTAIFIQVKMMGQHFILEDFQHQ